MDENFYHTNSVKGHITAAIVPVDQAERIKIIDSVRGIALLGILLMNIPYFALPDVVAENLAVYNEYSGINYYIFWIINLLFEGTMRGLFSLLFGAGCLLLLTRLENKSSITSAADIYYRRLLWLLVFGVINAFILLWPGDILYHYAICGMFLFPFRKLKPKQLLIIGIMFMLVSSIKGTFRWYQLDSVRDNGEKALVLETAGQSLTMEQADAKEHWLELQKKYNTDSLKAQAAATIQRMRGGYFAIMRMYSGLNAKFESQKFYQFIFWDVMGFLFVGMALFKWKILTGERGIRMYALLMIAGYLVGLAIGYWQLSTFIEDRFDPTLRADHLYVNLYQLKRLAMTLGHLGLIMIVYKLHLFDWLLSLLAKVGQMAFTNYLMQSIICTLIFYGYGLRWFGAMERYQIYIVVAGVWLFQIIFSNLWLSYYRFGPLEWVWRSLTYWKKQPIAALRRQNPS